VRPDLGSRPSSANTSSENRAAGTLRDDCTVADVYTIGSTLSAPSEIQRRLLDLMSDGLRPAGRTGKAGDLPADTGAWLPLARGVPAASLVPAPRLLEVELRDFPHATGLSRAARTHLKLLTCTCSSARRDY
jgi:hypothetical protein